MEGEALHSPAPLPRGAAPLARRAAAELIGTASLVAIVVGSGIQAAALSADIGVQLLANSLASAIGLGLLIVLFGPLSGGYLNPVVTLAAWWAGRHDGSGPSAGDAAAYVTAQAAGAVGGALLAEAMFGRATIAWSTQARIGDRLLLGEVVATAGLVLLIYGLTRIGRPQLTPVAVAAYIGAAIWFTSSGSFANPAATVGRAFTDSFTGISPASLPGFVGAQLAGGLLGIGLATLLFGSPPHRTTLPDERGAQGVQGAH
ncbi:aquaporin family protein [Streptomyces sp. YC537]|uniref:Aquaporin family protein n=1 Tax=Streptomyces boluensis TaxID=1775135 RepID=A0A964XLC3_9ACTN|nr:aquaporin family protein [Streptomyces boluensis]